jgi:hypothetical protein
MLLKGVTTMTPVMPALTEGVCPLAFPVLSNHRDAAKATLERLGVAVTVQWTLSRDLGRECTNSHRLSQRMMTLPIYPDLGSRTLERLGDAVRNGVLQ